MAAPMIGPNPRPIPKMIPQAEKAPALRSLLELMGENGDLTNQHRAAAQFPEGSGSG